MAKRSSDDDCGAHFSAAPPGRHPEDDELRAAGLSIWERTQGQEPVWRYGDVLLKQSEALEMVRRTNAERRTPRWRNNCHEHDQGSAEA